jgi:hypothetical protein
MSVIPAKIERNRIKPDGRHHACTPPANHTRGGGEVRCFGTGGGT